MVTELRTQFILRHDDTAAWLQAQDVVLAKAEIGIEFTEDTLVKFKIGDGKTAWKDLDYFGGAFKSIELGLTAIQAHLASIEDQLNNVKTLIGVVPAEQTVMSVIASLEEKHNKLVENVYTKEEIDAKITGAYRYRGTVKYYADLPTENLTIGDIYNIETADVSHGIAAGDNVAWNGTGWDRLAGIVDLSNQVTYDKFNPIKAIVEDIPNNYYSKTEASTIFETKKYEVLNTPVNTLINYSDKEIRIMCPENTTWYKQNVGDGGNENMYYMTFKAYAPENAVSFKEGDRGVIIDKMIRFEDESAGIDAYGRKYSICWLALAMYDAGTDTWTYFGKNSNESKYIGWDYVVEWYDANGHIIGNDSVRINLSNEASHYASKINTNKLVQTEGDILILNGGNATIKV